MRAKGDLPPPGYRLVGMRMDLPGNLYSLGEQYLKAAIAIAEAPPIPSRRVIQLKTWIGLPSAPRPKGEAAPIPMYFCIAHAAELFVKSYLAAKGESRSSTDLKAAWGKHDVGALIDAAIARGLTFDPVSLTLISEIVSQNDRFQLRFNEDTVPLLLPPPGRSIEAITRLSDNILPVVRPFFKVRS